jgi:hypothetical protein
MENLRKKNETGLQKNTEGQSSNITNRRQNLELEDEMVIKGKTEELLVK